MFIKLLKNFLASALFVLSAALMNAETSQKEPIRILAIGNSFSQDAVEQYLYELFAADGREVIIGNMYIGGCTLETHYKNSVSGEKKYYYRKVVKGVKTEKSRVELLYGLKDEKWDYISLQQASGKSGQYETYKPFLADLISYVKANATNPDAVLMWHATWAYSQDSNHGEFPKYGKDQMQMYNAILAAAQQAMNDNPELKIFIPSGTAIQNCRATYLGDTFNRDGYHLEVNFGRYTAACTWYEAISGKSVEGNNYAPASVPEDYKTVCQAAAHAAVMNPFGVTALPLYSAAANEIFVEAETFAQKGGWCLDQQFLDQMGSPYLIAHGMGKAVENASTSIKVAETGIYHVYARTYNWTSPWTDKSGAGAFKVRVGSTTLKNTLGTTGDKWEWQYAGSVKLKAGETTLALSDLTGFDGRVDAIYMTTDKNAEIPAEGTRLEAFRRARGGITRDKSQNASYDFVVVGGGIAGMCAAVAAAREGLKVALVNDRPVLGGNNSGEIRVHLGGNIGVGRYPELGKMLREFGHSTKGNANPAEAYEDDKKQAWIDAEKNITLYANTRAVGVAKKGSKISSVTVRNIESGVEFTLSAPLFSDCTGDGTIGYLAGADWRMGREARSEFGEELAPEVADDMTMGASVQWYSTEAPTAQKFPEFNYGVTFNESNCEKVTMGEWKWENGMHRNQITQAEQVRDYGLMVVYSNWSFLKNHLKDNAKYANRYLDWVAYVAGKRESRRLLGDYILHQDDIDKCVAHEDASFVTTWSIDLHFPDPANSANFPGNEFKAATKHIFIYPYDVPYRCLYSRNVDNLFMAGRNISVTHVALGTVRVMRTTGMMGEVVGMAAAICHKNGVSPRGVYQQHLEQLKSMMTKGAAVEGPLPDNQRFNEQKNLKEPKYHK